MNLEFVVFGTDMGCGKRRKDFGETAGLISHASLFEKKAYL
jgi:hypothetical protein